MAYSTINPFSSTVSLTSHPPQSPTTSPTCPPARFPSPFTTSSNTQPRTSRRTFQRNLPTSPPSIIPITRTTWALNTKHRHLLQRIMSLPPRLARRKRKRKRRKRRSHVRSRGRFASRRHWMVQRCIAARSVRWRIRIRACWSNICWVSIEGNSKCLNLVEKLWQNCYLRISNHSINNTEATLVSSE